MIYQKVYLAGLLHDIGKFLQKGSFGSLNVTGKHPEVSEAFINSYYDDFKRICDVDILKNLVIKHHEDRRYPESCQVTSTDENILHLAYIVSRADNYSSSEKNSKGQEYKDYKKRSLDSIVSNIDIGKSGNKILQYKVSEYLPENIMPVEIASQDEICINDMLSKFVKEIDSVLKSAKDFEKLYIQLLSILQKYTWCIPSNPQESIADISLFDHLRTTSAISACLYKYHESKSDFSIKAINNDSDEKFIMLVGDLSGIQSYIFGGINATAGNVAKRLRARSFHLSMLSELAAKLITREFDLPYSNIIMSSGGNVRILLPNIDEAENKLDRLQKNIDEFLFKEFEGMLSYSIAYEKMAGNDFENYDKLMPLLGKKLGFKKNNPFSGVITKDDTWDEKYFSIDGALDKEHGICKGCGREFAVSADSDKAYGKRCLLDIEIGGMIPRMTGYEFAELSKAKIPFVGGLGINPIIHNVPSDSNNHYISFESCEIDSEYSLTIKHAANYVPESNGSIMNFDEIAKKSKGRKMLGYLKADMDYLGSIFTFGFRKSSLSSVTTLSRMMDIFFAGRVNDIVKERFLNCYIVYSGGDDLLVIGPWDEIIDFAIALNNELKKFTGNNPNMTISAGVAFVRPRTPVSKAVEIAEKMLDVSKEKENKIKKEGRNQITSFNMRTLSWDDFAICIKEGQSLSKWYREKLIKNADLWRLKKYDQMIADYWENGRVEGLKYKSMIHYDIGRGKKERTMSFQYEKWLEGLFQLSSPLTLNLGVAVDYAIMSIREG